MAKSRAQMPIEEVKSLHRLLVLFADSQECFDLTTVDGEIVIDRAVLIVESVVGEMEASEGGRG